MKIKHILSLLIAIAIVSCKDNDVKPENPPVNDSELITTLMVKLTDSSDGSVHRFIFKDKDGEGGQAPEQFDSIRLKTNTTYFCELLYLDESKSTIDTVSNEIMEEANDHLIYFNIENLQIAIQITDKDNNNLPLGLHSIWRTVGISAGSTEIVLKHQPGVKDGSKDKGETDASVKFITLIE